MRAFIIAFLLLASSTSLANSLPPCSDNLLEAFKAIEAVELPEETNRKLEPAYENAFRLTKEALGESDLKNPLFVWRKLGETKDEDPSVEALIEVLAVDSTDTDRRVVIFHKVSYTTKELKQWLVCKD